MNKKRIVFVLCLLVTTSSYAMDWFGSATAMSLISPTVTFFTEVAKTKFGIPCMLTGIIMGAESLRSLRVMDRLRKRGNRNIERELSNGIRKNGEKIDFLARDVTGFRQETTANFSNLNTRFTTAEGQLANLQTGISDVKQKVVIVTQNMETRFDEVITRFNSAEIQRTGLRDAVQEVDQRVILVEQSTNQVRDAVRGLSEDQTVFRRTVTERFSALQQMLVDNSQLNSREMRELRKIFLEQRGLLEEQGNLLAANNSLLALVFTRLSPADKQHLTLNSSLFSPFLQRDMPCVSMSGGNMHIDLRSTGQSFEELQEAESREVASEFDAGNLLLQAAIGNVPDWSESGALPFNLSGEKSSLDLWSPDCA